MDTLGTGEYADPILTKAARDVFVLRPAKIIDALNLRTPRYRDLAVYGHIGRDYPLWEHTWRFDRDLQKAVETHAHRAAIHR
ncbi:methionine adenosyltransferase domain-containing protein [Cutibacterium sp.]|uniref:methionine adenosyltransferase domain-containing protein n=1 Tax=Cutibacterium sp. TaxID=1912221 RepID=UPI0026DC2B96|nr:methionine adenosyltransferase domain-containing protein [Cutibacterium sp.]MDO4413299.1 methionine adenosyltransferase domain-containing protein [Cutibacterium sp.]